ncbi:Proton-dependent oligopeptide transporter family [Macleaya cordata]|uniref:Proton-dependent oligopeptide transporter family n=1 Tax=Macleaya cordata TaxID=56857 RepID=A0A200QFC4_MACCD|nr:Proton-dependent oligopeptide transporter family [Macleaya cordata]
MVLDEVKEVSTTMINKSSNPSSWFFCSSSMKCFSFSTSSSPSSPTKMSSSDDQEDPTSNKIQLSPAGQLVAQRKPGGWKSMPYIIGNETFERLATFGLLANFMVYLLKQFHMDQVFATNVVNIWSGTTNFAPLVGAFISDAYLGKFRTLAYASIASLLGMMVLTLTAVIPELHPPSCTTQQQQDNQCIGPSTGQLGVLYMALGLLTLGAGGIRPCSLPFGVDQFDQTTDEGRKGINSFFNWYYFTFTLVVMIALTLVVYIQDTISWSWGLGIPTILMFCSILLFFLGTRIYVYVPPGGSVFSGIAQVFVAAYKKRRLELPSSAEELQGVLYDPPLKGTVLSKLPLTNQFRILNKAAVIIEGKVNADGSRSNQSKLCSIQQVEEVKCLLRIIPIWASGIICFTSMAQQGTFTVSQALKMDRHLGPKFQIPAGSLGVISMLTLGLWVPFYDRIFVPALRKITKQEGGITLLQRMGIGMVFSILSMVVAGFVEEKRRQSTISHSRPDGIAPISVFWLAPQLILMGLAEAFNIIGQIEFYNRQFPEHMRSIANSLFFCTMAGANYLSSVLVAIIHSTTGKLGRPDWLYKDINAGKLDYFYFLIAGLGVLNFIYFLVVAQHYRYKASISVGGEDMDVVIELSSTKQKLGTFGISSNLIVYFTTVFNMKRVTAAILINAFTGTTYFSPLIGGYLADAYFGRYKTLGFASVTSLMGMVLVMLTAMVSKLHPPNCGMKNSKLCAQPTAPQWAFLLCALGLLVIGAGGIRPCNLAFGADQFNPNTDAGKRSINSFINWYFFVLSSSTLVSLTLIIYVQSNLSWTVGLALPACLMFMACILFFMGSKIYVKVKPQGSPVISIIQVVVAATKKWRLKQPDNPQVSLFNHFPTNSINSKLHYTDRINPDGSAANPWRLCRLQQVEEVKCLMRVIPIWISSAIFHIAVLQQHTYAVFQALQSDRRLGKSNFKVPAASYMTFSWLSMAISILVYDRFVVPSLRKLTGQEGGITLLQRMGTGTFLSMIAMLVSALVEKRRRNFALTHPTLGLAKGGGAISSMSGFWLIPQLAINGLAESFNHLGQVEFYYKQFPENMRSIAVSFFFLGFAVGSYASGFMVSIVHHTTEGAATGNWLPEDLNKGRLDYFYYMITMVEVLNFVYFFVWNEIFEKLGTFGISANLVVYLTTFFNIKHVTAAILISVFHGTTFFTPLIGGFVADTFLGRYKTIGFASIASLTGMFLIMLTATISKLHPPNCGTKNSELCVQPTAPQWAFLLGAMVFLVIGSGGIRPCNMAFGADQFDPKNDGTKRSINSFINWYYFVISACLLVSLTLIVYVQSNLSWALGLALPPCLMFLACLLYFMGSRIYVKVKPEGSPVTSVIQVLVAATKKWRLTQPDKPELSLFNHFSYDSINSKLDYTDQFRFLDKAAIVTVEDRIKADGSAANPWRLSRMQQVEEVKCLARVLPIWASSAIFHVTLNQQQTYAVFQALQSDRRLGKFEVPAASYLAFSWLSMAIWIPIYDRFVTPSLRKLTGQEGGITLLQRMGIGTLLSMITMLVSGLVEQRRRHIALTYPTLGITKGGGAISSMSGLWLIPQLALNGLAEAFSLIGQVEFYYKQFPENMRSIGMSFYFLGIAVGSYVSGFLVSIVHRTTDGAATGNWLAEDLNKGRLDYFYYMITMMEVVNFLYFVVCARWYRYKGTGNEMFEKLGTWGTLSNLVVYFTTVFNMKRVTAAIILNVFSGTTFFSPLIGAFLADSYFGRYKTLGFASIASFTGMLLLMLTAMIKKLHPRDCGTKDNKLCVQPTAAQWAFLSCAMGLLVIGAGGIRPCNMPFGADQFNPKTDSGKRSINSYINWYYFVLSSCLLVSLTLIVYVQSNLSWTVGLALPACLMLIACVLFFAGSRHYVKVKPEGSPVTNIIQVLVAATKKRRLVQPENPEVSLFNYFPTSSINSKLHHSYQFRFLDKAAIATVEDRINADGSAANPWRLCRMQQVEEVKCLIRVLPIWVSAAIFHIALNQQQTYAVYQAFQSDRHLGKSNFEVPAASYMMFSWLSMAIWIPVYDQLVVPSLRKVTGQETGFTLLQRMGIGTFLSIIAMLVSALVEQKRRNFALTHPTLGITKGGGAISSMSGLWLIPQLTINGLADAFCFVGQVGFYYKQFPENMRSIAMSFFLVSMAIASYVSGFIVSIVHQTTKGAVTGNWLSEDLNKGRLDYFYYMITVIEFVNLVYFLVCARWYRY